MKKKTMVKPKLSTSFICDATYLRIILFSPYQFFSKQEFSKCMRHQQTLGHCSHLGIIYTKVIPVSATKNANLFTSC